MRPTSLRAAVLAASALFLGVESDAAVGQSGPCDQVSGALPGRECLSTLQAFESAYPQVGILLTGGSAFPGTASTAGIRLGRFPGVSVSAAVRGAEVNLPDILTRASGPGDWPDTGDVQVFAPAVSLDVAAEVFRGINLAPTLGGVGSVELLAGVTWMPFEIFDVDGFGEGNPLGYGGAVRIGVLRESFTAPAVAVAVGYRRAEDVRFGDFCVAAEPGYQLCQRAGDRPGTSGEAVFDVASWNARATVAKRLAGVGLTGGVGYDRFAADGRFSFRRIGSNFAETYSFLRSSDESRWSAFGGASMPLLVGSITLEAGWMQGGDAVEGYGPWQPTGAPEQVPEHDPGQGTFFGSLSGRIHL